MGVMVDRDILKYMKEGYFKHFDIDHLLSIGYDLRPQSYYNSEGEHYEQVRLSPGDSIFVGCIEIVELPSNVMAEIKIRNSRIRQGLHLEAPIYQPGHSTRIFYRLTNISKSTITLSLEDGTAYIIFSTLSSEPENIYNGAFQHEEGSYNALSTYSEQYRKQMSKVEDFAFLIMPFSEPWSQNMHTLIKNAGSDANIDIRRADDIYGFRPVMHDVAHLTEHARVVIAVLTGGNRNVNYELGLAHAWGKPSIMIASAMDDIPFDYRHLRVIIYDTQNPNWGAELSRKLCNTLQSIIDEKVIGYNYFEANHQ